jgi:hypothetical protein
MWRNLNDKIVYSHIYMIMPVLWWIFYVIPDNPNLFDKFIVCITGASLVSSIYYHLSYETRCREVEPLIQLLGNSILLLYLFYRGIHIMCILFCISFLLFIKDNVASCSNKGIVYYNQCHYICHIYAGMYITFVVYLLSLNP